MELSRPVAVTVFWKEVWIRPSGAVSYTHLLTVKARAGDNLFLHQALDMAQPGDVIVLSNDEDTTRSLMGEIMFTYAKYQKKLGGLVIDGPVRDVDALREMDLPVYATGSTPGGPHRCV